MIDMNIDDLLHDMVLETDPTNGRGTCYKEHAEEMFRKHSIEFEYIGLAPTYPAESYWLYEITGTKNDETCGVCIAHVLYCCHLLADWRILTEGNWKRKSNEKLYIKVYFDYS